MPLTEAWVTRAAGAGCTNWNEIKIDFSTREPDSATCGNLCASTEGCIGFAYGGNAASCVSENERKCWLWKGFCITATNDCYDEFTSEQADYRWECHKGHDCTKSSFEAGVDYSVLDSSMYVVQGEGAGPMIYDGGHNCQACKEICDPSAACIGVECFGGYCSAWKPGTCSPTSPTWGDGSGITTCFKVPLTISGDPIVNINGFKVKFDLPVGESSLMWQDDALEIYAKADVVTPNNKNQWFSDIILATNGRKAAHIQRKVIALTSKEQVGTLNTLSLTTFDETNHEVAATGPGSYHIGNGTAVISVSRDGAKVGPLSREVVAVSSKSISFSVASEKAKKFANDAKKALKYVHLDINLHKMDEKYVKAGIFAELWGLIPMSEKTANTIRSIKA